jgi:DNA-binding beta-propeller fold protein YncE
MTASPATIPAGIPAADPAFPEAQAPGSDQVPPATADDERGDRGRRRKVVLLLLLLGMFIALLLLAIWYLLFRQPLPLPPIPATQVPHYTSTLYGVDRPMGVAVNAAGDRIYVAQSAADNRVAVVLDAQGNKLTEMLPPLSTGTEHAPVYVAVDPLSGEVYVTDRPTGDIYVYDANGAYLRQFAPTVPRNGFQPLGIAFDRAGNLYVTDLGGNPASVVEFDRTGTVVRELGRTDGLDFPNGVAIDNNGYVYVTDSNDGRLLVYDQNGVLAARVGRGAGAGNLGLPRGVGVDGNGRVFVMDTSGQACFVYRQAQPGQARLDFVGTFGAQGVSNGQFMYPTGLAVDGTGRLFVADTANGRIQLWNY